MAECRFWEPITIRWNDLDSLGHVNNAVYFTYLEIARTAYIRKVLPAGLWTREQGPVLVRAAYDFGREILFKHEIEVGCRSVRLGNSSWEIDHPIRFRDSGEPAGMGKVVVVWSDFINKKSKPLPLGLRRSLIAFEGEALQS